MTDKILQKYCEGAVAILNSQYEATKVLKHHATSGAARERILRDFLSDHLPQLISVVSGQIVDAQDNYSRQQDIVLVLKSMPRLPFASGNDLIFQEGVVATLEIKTTLSSSVLKTIGENIASARRLVPSIVVSAQMGITHTWPSTRVLTAIVTYGGVSLESLSQQLHDLTHDEKPDLLLDLSKGLLIRNHDLLVPQQDNDEYILVDSAAEGFKQFLTFLTEITGTLSSRGVSWREYW